jgi:hypothetical protein
MPRDETNFRMFPVRPASKTGSYAFDEASGGEIPIVSQIARNLNNRCRKW